MSHYYAYLLARYLVKEGAEGANVSAILRQVVMPAASDGDEALAGRSRSRRLEEQGAVLAGDNLVAVAVPVAATIFLTDAFSRGLKL